MKEVFIIIMRVTVASVKGRLFFNILEDILSIPEALLVGYLLITFCTQYSVALLSLNNS